MKFSDIINSNNWLSVKLTLLEIFPDQIELIDSYDKTFCDLQQMQSVESDLEIVLTRIFDDENEESSYVDVSGRKKYIDIRGNSESYAIEFTPWNQWLGMDVSIETLSNFNELEIIAHSINEMTYVGFDELEIKSYLSNVEGRVEEYKQMTDEEKEKNITSLEDLIKKYKIDDSKPDEPENSNQ